MLRLLSSAWCHWWRSQFSINNSAHNRSLAPAAAACANRDAYLMSWRWSSHQFTSASRSMKLHGEMPCGEFITRAQPAEKEDRNADQAESKEDSWPARDEGKSETTSLGERNTTSESGQSKYPWHACAPMILDTKFDRTKSRRIKYTRLWGLACCCYHQRCLLPFCPLPLLILFTFLSDAFPVPTFTSLFPFRLLSQLEVGTLLLPLFSSWI